MLSEPFVSRTMDVRGLEYCVHTWGNRSKPKLLLLHGWMDCGASFQFIAPYLVDNFYLIASDLRGFGKSEHASQGYWFLDYVADVEVLLRDFFGDEKANIVGHSMGGNIAMLYAGIQKHNVAKVMSMEGFGLNDTKPTDAVKKYRQWLHEIIDFEQGKTYPNKAALMSSIRAVNPKLKQDMVESLTQLWGREVNDGKWQLQHDHRHRFTHPIRYNYADVKAVWSEMSAELGLLYAEQSWANTRMPLQQRMSEIQSLCGVKEQHIYRIQNSDHMMHLEQPEATAECISDFFKST